MDHLIELIPQFILIVIILAVAIAIVLIYFINHNVHTLNQKIDMVMSSLEIELEGKLPKTEERVCGLCVHADYSSFHKQKCLLHKKQIEITKNCNCENWERKKVTEVRDS